MIAGPVFYTVTFIVLAASTSDEGEVMTFFKERMLRLRRGIVERFKFKASASGGGIAARTHAKEKTDASPQWDVPLTPSSLPVSPEMQRIYDERGVYISNIGWAAARSVVSEGPVHHLLANHEAELTEHKRLLGVDTLAVSNGMKRLAGLFPLPEAAPPEPPRERYYPTVDDLYGMRPGSRMNRA